MITGPTYGITTANTIGAATQNATLNGAATRFVTGSPGYTTNVATTTTPTRVNFGTTGTSLSVSQPAYNTANYYGVPTSTYAASTIPYGYTTGGIKLKYQSYLSISSKSLNSSPSCLSRD